MYRGAARPQPGHHAVTRLHPQIVAGVFDDGAMRRDDPHRATLPTAVQWWAERHSLVRDQRRPLTGRYWFQLVDLPFPSPPRVRLGYGTENDRARALVPAVAASAAPRVRIVWRDGIATREEIPSTAAPPPVPVTSIVNLTGTKRTREDAEDDSEVLTYFVNPEELNNWTAFIGPIAPQGPPEDHFTCPICLEETHERVVKVCEKHTLCHFCAEGLYDSDEWRHVPGRRKGCPCCRAPIDNHIQRLITVELPYGPEEPETNPAV